MKIQSNYIAGVRPYKCNLCEKSFTQRCSLESHCLKVHGVAHQYDYKQRRSKVKLHTYLQLHLRLITFVYYSRCMYVKTVATPRLNRRSIISTWRRTIRTALHFSSSTTRDISSSTTATSQVCFYNVAPRPTDQHCSNKTFYKTPFTRHFTNLPLLP